MKPQTLLQNIISNVRILKFAAVGLSGVFVNMTLFWAGSAFLFAGFDDATRVLLASSFAVALSIVSNFLLNDAWTWRDRRSPGLFPFFKRMIKYTIVAGAAAVVQIAVTYLLAVYININPLVLDVIAFFGEPVEPLILNAFAHNASSPGELLSNLIAIATATIINFVFNNLWTFRQKGEAATPPSSTASPPA